MCTELGTEEMSRKKGIRNPSRSWWEVNVYMLDLQRGLCFCFLFLFVCFLLLYKCKVVLNLYFLFEKIILLHLFIYFIGEHTGVEVRGQLFIELLYRQAWQQEPLPPEPDLKTFKYLRTLPGI